jgi:hypothetical protein
VRPPLAETTQDVRDLELEYKPDAAKAIERMSAWWEGAILDRATIQVTAPKPNLRPMRESTHASLRDRWMDGEYQVARAAAWVGNTYWGGEILPAFVPDLGPEVMTAALGAELVFGEDTSWSVPILHDWADIGKLVIDPGSEYVSKIIEMTELGLEAGRRKFLVGLTDLHPGADLAASLRDPQQLCLDLVTEPERVHELMDQLRPTFYTFYELQDRLLREAGQPVTTSWLSLFAQGRYYIPSADFSCMISNEMFREFFLPEILEEIEWLGRSIYHLDGSQALHHLDTILEIGKLGAVQYVWGEGQGPASKWMDVFRRVQEAGKNLHISIEPWEIDSFVEALRPEGVMLQMRAGSIEEADALIARVSRWT